MIDEDAENPGANQLSAGVTDEQLEQAVRVSGYPLQRVVAEELLRDFVVTEEWGFLDRQSRDHRALDLLACRELRDTAGLWLRAALLVECKRSDLPYVFFEGAAPHSPRDFPVVAGLHGKTPNLRLPGGGTRSSTVAELLKLADFPFVANAPRVANSFARAERKGSVLELSGSVLFNQVVLPLVSALQHFVQQEKDVVSRGSSAGVSACLALPICVVDGPIVTVRGGPAAPQMSLSPWVRVVRQEAVEERHWVSWRYDVVDFVHRAYLRTFVKNQLLPFADQFVERAMAGAEFLRDGGASVPESDNWNFGDLRPVASAGPV